MCLDASPAPDPSNRGGGGGIPIPSIRPPDTRPSGAATYVQLWAPEGTVVRRSPKRTKITGTEPRQLESDDPGWHPTREEQRRAAGDRHSSQGTARSRAYRRLYWSGYRIEYRPHPLSLIHI